MASAATSLRNCHTQLNKLISESSYWQGDAAKAFRDAIDGELPTYIKNAARSLEKAAAQLGIWDGDLTSNRDLAQKYDAAAAEKKSAVASAKERHAQAGKHPDLRLAGQQFPTQEEADAATARLRAAEHSLNEATIALNKANGEYNDIIAKAEALEHSHTDSAETVAKSLDDATDKLAPREPGWLSKAVDAIWDGIKATGDFLLEHAGTIGAIAGLLALIPGPWSPALLAVSVLCSAVQLGNDIGDGALQDLAHWPPNMDTLGAATSIGGDVLGMLPGVGVAARAASGTIKGAAAAARAGTALSAADKAAQFGQNLVKVTGRVANSGAAGASGMERGLAGLGAGTTLYSDLVDHGAIGEDKTRDNVNQVGNSASTFNKPAYDGVVDVVSDVKGLATAVFR
ncbi:putative T7SS-secreted protein [Streptomyces sp. NPDC049541]|uniref:putative T7SS-secreted protein n=1 Tax=Streptomyces sp. NPDC049541 TaxID=3365594 RepID=UPI00378C0F3D